MGFTIREQATINDNFKVLIRGGNYEKLIEQLCIAYLVRKADFLVRIGNSESALYGINGFDGRKK